LAKLAAAEQEKKLAAEREAARVAALQAQAEKETVLAKINPTLITRAILPADYKRREHYYLQVDQLNSAAIEAANAQNAAQGRK
jgi:hypothetical protein